MSGTFNHSAQYSTIDSDLKARQWHRYSYNYHKVIFQHSRIKLHAYQSYESYTAHSKKYSNLK